MNIFVAVYPKDKNALDKCTELIKDAFYKTVPFASMPHSGVLWKNKRVVAASFSIHEKNTPIQEYACSRENHFLTFNGVPLFECDSGQSWSEMLMGSFMEGTLNPENIGGYYNLLYINHGILSAWNCITRSEPIYWCETADYITVGNRAFLVYSVAHENSEYEYDLPALVPLATAGFMVNDGTSLKGVHVLPNGHLLRVFDGRIYLAPYKPYTFIEDTHDNDALYNILYDEICHAFLKSIKTFSSFYSEPLLVNLSGGKDSRIIASICASAKVAFRCGTCGSPDDRDVIVAKEVAAILDVDHCVNSPMDTNAGEIPKVDIMQMLEQHIMLTEGMFNILEPIYPIRQSPRFLLNGHGGECLRGGYEHKTAEEHVTDTSIAKKFLRYLSLHNQDVFLTPEGKRVQSEENDRILSRFQESDFPLENIRDYIFTVYRQGRHFCNARQGAGYGAFSFTPYLDDDALILAWTIPLRLRKNDILYYNLLQRLSPELSEHRFADSRWLFEQDGPLSGTSYDDWIKRAPLPPSPPIAGPHNWRMGYDDYLRPIISDFFSAQKDCKVFEYVDYAKLAEVLNNAAPTPYGILRSVFGILTMTYLVSEQWHKMM